MLKASRSLSVRRSLSARTAGRYSHTFSSVFMVHKETLPLNLWLTLMDNRSLTDRTSALHMERMLGGEVLHSTDAWSSSHSLIQVIKRTRSDEVVRVPAVAEPLLVWIVSGQALVKERYPNEVWQEQTVTAGYFYLTTSTLPYEMQWQVVAGESFTVMHIYLERARLNQAFRYCYQIPYDNGKLADVSGTFHPELNHLFALCYDEITIPENRSPDALDALLTLIALTVTRRYGSVGEGKVFRPDALPVYKLNRAKRYMLDHLQYPFSLAQLAAHCEISEFYFSRRFKQATGISPSAWFMQQRIERACRLLRETSLSLTDIALEVGYSSHSHFSRVFRKVKGINPAEYRRV